MKYRYKWMLLLQCCFCLITNYAPAQSIFNYTPLKDDASKLTSFRKIVGDQYIEDSLKTTGENKKYILEIYRDRFKSIDELFEDKELIAAADIDAYLNAITSEIINKNPALKAISPHFFFSRSWIPNAYSTGEGTIVFNIGLFSRLKNESQVAFVLCHELAHLFLQHSNKKIDKYISTVYSDEFQKQLKHLKKQEFDKKTALDKLEMGMTFKNFRHSRDSESEADSTGFVFMKNTQYDCSEALGCLALLDKIDEETFDIDTNLPQLFTSSEYPFKSRWLQQQDVFFGGIDKNEKKPLDDSLKTHPDCQARIKSLTPLIEKLKQPATRKFIQPEQRFYDLQTLFQFEIINHCISSKKVSKGLFYTIKLLDKYPANAYLVATTGECFNEMYNKQKDHRLNTIVELPSPYKETNYNRLLEFISQLSLSEISNIGYHFLKQQANKLTADASFEKVFAQSKQVYNQTNK